MFQFEDLGVMKNLDVEVLSNTPFIEVNGIAFRPTKRLITLADDSSFTRLY